MEVELLARAGNVRKRRPRAARQQERAPSPGETAAHVFQMLREGLVLRDIVVNARVTPERARALHREWLVGLSEGERLRAEQIERERERREDLDDQRLQLEFVRAWRAR